MKKLEYKLLPCVFCTIGLNSYIIGHNLVQVAMKKCFTNKKATPSINKEINPK